MIYLLLLFVIQFGLGRLGPRRRREPTIDVLAKIVDRARSGPGGAGGVTAVPPPEVPVGEQWGGGPIATDGYDPTTELPMVAGAPAAGRADPDPAGAAVVVIGDSDDGMRTGPGFDPPWNRAGGLEGDPATGLIPPRPSRRARTLVGGAMALAATASLVVALVVATGGRSSPSSSRLGTTAASAGHAQHHPPSTSRPAAPSSTAGGSTVQAGPAGYAGTAAGSSAPGSSLASQGANAPAPTRTAASSFVASAPAGPPTVSALQPAHGQAGQQVVISGTGFLSPNGVITAYFGAVTAPTSCSSPTTCTVTVPPPLPSGPAGAPSGSGSASAATGPGVSVSVTVVTDSGRSNPVSFTYG